MEAPPGFEPEMEVLQLCGPKLLANAMTSQVFGSLGAFGTSVMRECRMEKRFYRIVATLIVAVSVGLIGCGGGTAAEQSASTRVAAGSGAPSGAYESSLPDGTVIRLSFRDGGAVGIAMTEEGKTASYDGKWILNGEVILVEGGEGLMLQLSWRGNDLVTDFGGVTLTFKKV